MPDLQQPRVRFSQFQPRRRPHGLWVSAAAHLVVVLLLATVFSTPPARRWARGTLSLILPVTIQPYSSPPHDRFGGGGGGGGLHDPLPASRGKPTRFRQTREAPPMVPANPKPLLVAELLLIGAPDTVAPQVDDAFWGDPLAAVGPLSGGPGSGGGFGSGNDGGIGNRSGRGLGPGTGDGCCDGVYSIGGGVSRPRLVRRIEPEYSEQARKAKWQGTVVLAIEVWPDGRAHNIRVVQPLGMGLDAKAVEAVRQWLFEPARRGGEPVRVRASIEVNFRLL